MKKLLKQLLPPFLQNFIKKIYFFLLIKKNSFKLNKNSQDIKLYDKDEDAEKIDEWVMRCME